MREKRSIFLFNRFRTIWTVINLEWWLWSARRRKLHVERLWMVQAVNIIQYIERLEALITRQLMRQFAIIGLRWTGHDEKAIVSFQMGNDIQESPSTIVDSQLFKHTNPNSILSSSTASLLATLQPSANTVGTGVIRWFKFALCRSGTIFLKGIIPLDVQLCRHCTWVYPWNHKGCFQISFSPHFLVLTFESWYQWATLKIRGEGEGHSPINLNAFTCSWHDNMKEDASLYLKLLKKVDLPSLMWRVTCLKYLAGLAYSMIFILRDVANLLAKCVPQ